MNSNIMAIQFHEQSLSAILVDSIPHVALKPICENIGIDWEAQRQKINRHPVLKQVACMIQATSLGQDGKSYVVEMLMLPIKYLNGWLFGVDTNRVKNGTREKLIEYQRECFDVLANHFMPKLQTPTNPQAPRAKFSVPGGLSLESQDVINDAIAARACILPKDKQGGAVINMRSALVTKYDLKGVKHGYKNIPDDQLTNVLNLLARLPLEGDQYLTYTKEDLDLLIQAEVAKALPPPIKEGELFRNSDTLPNLENTLTIQLHKRDKPQRYLITQGESDLTVIRALSDDTLVGVADQVARDLKADGYIVVKKAEVLDKLLA